MSMNIRCSAIQLPQIGTWESLLILSTNEAGDPDGGWRGVARRYLLWTQGQRQVEFNAASQNSETQQRVDEFWNARIQSMREAVVVAEAADTSITFWVE